MLLAEQGHGKTTQSGLESCCWDVLDIAQTAIY